MTGKRKWMLVVMKKKFIERTQHRYVEAGTLLLWGFLRRSIWSDTGQHTLLIPPHRRQRQVYLWVQDQPGPCSEILLKSGGVGGWREGSVVKGHNALVKDLRLQVGWLTAPCSSISRFSLPTPKIMCTYPQTDTHVCTHEMKWTVKAPALLQRGSPWDPFLHKHH